MSRTALDRPRRFPFCFGIAEPGFHPLDDQRELKLCLGAKDGSNWEHNITRGGDDCDSRASPLFSSDGPNATQQ
jgi:hypothetical protein